MRNKTVETILRRRTRTSAGERQDLNYRQLRIVAGVQNGRSKAIAYQGGRMFLAAEATDVPAAVLELKRVIDDLHHERESSRPDGIPTAEEYADAFLRLDRLINNVQQSAIVRHAARADARTMLSQLSDQIGVSSDILQKAYVRLGRYVGDVLNFQPELQGLRKPLQPILVIAEPVGLDAEPEWVLRPNVVAALQIIDGLSRS